KSAAGDRNAARGQASHGQTLAGRRRARPLPESMGSRRRGSGSAVPMVTASMTGKTPLFRRTVERKAAGDRGVAPASMRSIVIDPGAAGLRGWYRIKIASPDNRLRWVQVEAIDKTGV